eukprot:COSAG06_NODE_38541_length_422_cov_0.972136_1_plen_73_part_00
MTYNRRGQQSSRQQRKGPCQGYQPIGCGSDGQANLQRSEGVRYRDRLVTILLKYLSSEDSMLKVGLVCLRTR